MLFFRRYVERTYKIKHIQCSIPEDIRLKKEPTAFISIKHNKPLATAYRLYFQQFVFQRSFSVCLSFIFQTTIVFIDFSIFKIKTAQPPEKRSHQCYKANINRPDAIVAHTIIFYFLPRPEPFAQFARKNDILRKSLMPEVQLCVLSSPITICFGHHYGYPAPMADRSLVRHHLHTTNDNQ